MDIYYPLFEEILHGQLSPERGENADGLHFTRKLQKLLVGRNRFTGVYQLWYYDASSAKEQYYRTILLQELDGYCFDVVEELKQETNVDVLRYRRKQLLSDHLTTCLMRLGERIRTGGYALSCLASDTPGVSTEAYANSYVYHLLKCCLIKAYLEIQNVLERVVASPIDEKMIRATLVGESLPIDRLYLQRNKIIAEKGVKIPPRQASPPKEPNAPVASPFYTTAEVCELLRLSESTVNRRVLAGELHAVKVGKAYRFPKEEMDHYLNELKGRSK